MGVIREGSSIPPKPLAIVRVWDRRGHLPFRIQAQILWLIRLDGAILRGVDPFDQFRHGFGSPDLSLQ